MQRVSDVTAASLMMALPGLFGHWADEKLGTGMLLLVLGAIFGLIMGMWHLTKLTKPPGGGDRSGQETNDDPPN